MVETRLGAAGVRDPSSCTHEDGDARLCAIRVIIRSRLGGRAQVCDPAVPVAVAVDSLTDSGRGAACGPPATGACQCIA